MSWFAQTANATEAAKDNCLMFLAVDVQFASGHVRLWSGIGDLTFGGNTYTGAGELGRVSMPPDSTALSAERKTYQLSNVDPAAISEADLENSFGLPVTEYFGFMDPTTRALIAEPEINWEGRMDMVRRADGKEPIVEINAEHRHVLLDRADGFRYTHEHQQDFYAGDKGFNQVASLENKEVIWGGHKTWIGAIGVRLREVVGSVIGGG